MFHFNLQILHVPTKGQITQQCRAQLAEKDKEISKLNALVSKLMLDLEQVGKRMDALTKTNAELKQKLENKNQLGSIGLDNDFNSPPLVKH
jgi:septal ring factor EnvC (AmiA/AmiB activator)